jgi:Na+/H+ antiporter NhaD/arsenite permease-like protein
MEFTQTAAAVIFLGSIILVVTAWIDSVVAAMGGILLMIFCGIMTDVQAFQIVDWNVILILLSIWIISGYFGKSGVPDFLAALILKMSKGNVALFVAAIGMAGFVSILIDNAVVVLMSAPVIFHACRRFLWSVSSTTADMAAWPARIQVISRVTIGQRPCR